MRGTLPKVDLNVDNFELWMTLMSAVESADQIWWWIIVVMVHMHHSQPLKMKFGTNHFLGSETLVPLQYRVRVKNLPTIYRQLMLEKFQMLYPFLLINLIILSQQQLPLLQLLPLLHHFWRETQMILANVWETDPH